MNITSLKLFKVLSLTLIIFSYLSLKSNNLKIQLNLENIENVYDKRAKKTIPSVYTNETFQIKVVVNSKKKNTGDIEIVGLDNLNIEGTSRTKSDITINNNKKLAITHIYDVSADKAGTIIIGPAQIKQNNQIIKSNPETINLHVISKTDGSKINGTSSNLNSINQKGDFFCKLNTNKTNVFVGEPIILTLSTYSKGNVIQAGIQPPKFPGFIHKEIDQIIRREENVDNNFYNVIEKQYILLPTEPGIKEILPLEIVFQIRSSNKKRNRDVLDNEFLLSFFRPLIETRKTTSNNLEIKVNPLPKYNGNVDGVGKFTSVSTFVDKQEAIINEPVVLKIEIDGEGNLDQIIAPKLNLPNFINYYESKTDLKENLSSESISGKKTFEYILQISKIGECEIPQQTFVYFDPESKSYKKAQTNKVKLNINAPTGSQTLNRNENLNNFNQTQNTEIQKEISTNQKDIHFIEEDIDSIDQKETNYMPFWLFILFLILFPVTFYFSKVHVHIIKKFKSNLKSNTTFKNKLEEIKQKNDATLLYKFFLDYLAEKFHIDVHQINENFIKNKLAKTNWNEEKINNFLDYLNDCASLSFATNIKNSTNEQKLLEKGKYWFLLLESNSPKSN